MSYTPLRSIHRFSVFYRTSSATAAIGSSYAFQGRIAIPASRALSSFTPTTGALCLMNIQSSAVAYSPLIEFSPAGTTDYVAGGDMFPSLGASASNGECAIGLADGSNAIQIRIDNGFEVNDSLLANSTALILE
jgi:hypothetical protein